MPGIVPQNPKIYHIVHVDRLASIIASKGLLCDAVMVNHAGLGTTIGMSNIKQRRLTQLKLTNHPELFVGQYVPFYFCPRSIMLYLLHRGNHDDLDYKDGEDSVIHLEADLLQTVDWAQQNNKRWAFTLSNAGANYVEDRCDLAQLDEINWDAVNANKWSGLGIPSSVKEGKQAEFLIEESFPWHLISKIGVRSNRRYGEVLKALQQAAIKPHCEIMPDWYYSKSVLG